MKKNNNPKETVAIGRVGSPSGLRGEVRINLYAQDSNNLKEGKVLLLQHTEKTDGRGVEPGSAPARENRKSRGGAPASGGVKKRGAEQRWDEASSSAPAICAKIVSVRLQKEKPVIKLEGFGDRTAVEALRGMEVSIEAGDMEALPEGEHYVRDLIGCSVIDIAAANSAGAAKDSAASGSTAGAVAGSADTSEHSNGRLIGALRDVIQNTAQSILEVETPEGKTVLIPAVDAFLRNIDEESGIIEVELIPGFY